MRCPQCGAPAEKTRHYCAVCGAALQAGLAREWDRASEAAAYEDLRQGLEGDEQLLGSTRGRLAGSWRQRAAMSPQAVLTPYVNLGLTARRLMLQPVNAASGRAMPGLASIPLPDVRGVSVSDSDPTENGRAARVVVSTDAGMLRLRVAGRHAESARELQGVWETLSGDGTAPGGATRPCPHCGVQLDGPHKFCPFCGKEQPR